MVSSPLVLESKQAPSSSKSIGPMMPRLQRICPLIRVLIACILGASYLAAGPGDGRIVSTTKIINSGPASSKLNLVIVSEGYKESELGAFEATAQTFATSFLATAPIDRHTSSINVYRINVASTESGADDPAACGGTGAEKKTYFDATFCADQKIRRLLYINETTAYNVLNAQVPEWTAAIFFVNSSVYGGGGGNFAVASQVQGVSAHELGHALFDLADEYEYWSGCYSGETGHDSYTGSEPTAVNVTKNKNKSTLKWGNLVFSDTALPTSVNKNCTECDTQSNPATSTTVGAFEGAQYYHCGKYRPYWSCMMSDGGGFCPVCVRQIDKMLSVYAPTAEIYDPPNGSLLTAGAIKFSWGPGSGVSSYWLQVGKEGDKTHYYTESQGTSLSKTVTGLPIDGSKIYVTIFSKIGASWQSNEYIYTALTTVKASMTSPTPGSTLSSTSVTFTWNSGRGVSFYRLELGSTVGGSDYYSSPLTTSLSKTVSALPLNGGKIYVRLSSTMGNAVEYRDYTYTAGSSTKAAMTSPTSNSTFTSTSVTFSWDAGKSVTAYRLDVGKTAGGTEYYAGVSTTSRSKAISGFLTDSSKVYARLSSKIGDAWQYNDYTYNAAASTKAQITTPAGGATFTSSSVAFSWTAGIGVTEYRLDAGKTVGGTDYYTGSTGTSRSKTVSGLPLDGSKIYVRLQSKINSAWQFNDYTYTAGTPTKAGMITPSPGSTLSSSSVKFTWNAGIGVTEYRLDIGKTTGASDYYGASQGSSLTRTVSGLPTNGVTIYVRLGSKISGSWQNVDYTYTAVTATKATMLLPTPGTTLSSSTITFTWDSGKAVSQYQLAVGKTSGGSEYYLSPLTSTLSKSVSALPTDGSKIYVRLLSKIDSLWLNNDYTYTAFTYKKAEILSPVPGSTLTSNNAMFVWDAGIGATQYKLDVGSSVGGTQYYAGPEAATRSKIVTGLPTNGSKIYVRLSTKIAGAWQYNDYTYTAKSGS